MKSIDKAIHLVSGVTKLNDYDLAIEIRDQITGENEAINGYMVLASRISDSTIRKIIIDIAAEEKVHVGELQQILYKLDPGQKSGEEEGHKENT